MVCGGQRWSDKDVSSAISTPRDLGCPAAAHGSEATLRDSGIVTYDCTDGAVHNRAVRRFRPTSFQAQSQSRSAAASET